MLLHALLCRQKNVVFQKTSPYVVLDGSPPAIPSRDGVWRHAAAQRLLVARSAAGHHKALSPSVLGRWTPASRAICTAMTVVVCLSPLSGVLDRQAPASPVFCPCLTAHFFAWYHDLEWCATIKHPTPSCFTAPLRRFHARGVLAGWQPETSVVRWCSPAEIHRSRSRAMLGRSVPEKSLCEPYLMDGSGRIQS